MLLGNDIVDLSIGGDHHPRFPRRILNDLEFQTYEDSGFDPEHLWLVWAAKESAYKLEKRRDSSICFSPREFSVNLDFNTVTWRGRLHSFDCERSAAYLHVWVAEQAFHVEARSADIFGEVTPESQSSRVRELAVEVISMRLKIPVMQLKVQTDAARLPYATRLSPAGEERLNCVISLSHDGGYVGVAIGFDKEAF